MGFFDNFKKAINPTDDNYDDYNDIYDEEEGYNEEAYEQPEAFTPVNNQRTTGGMGLNSGALELKVVKPEKYDSATAQKIADHLLNKRSVVLNLESTNKESARRLIDFLSGVAYSIDGYIQRVALNTFIIVPQNVDISGEQLQEAKKQDDADLF